MIKSRRLETIESSVKMTTRAPTQGRGDKTGRSGGLGCGHEKSTELEDVTEGRNMIMAEEVEDAIVGEVGH